MKEQNFDFYQDNENNGFNKTKVFQKQKSKKIFFRAFVVIGLTTAICLGLSNMGIAPYQFDDSDQSNNVKSSVEKKKEVKLSEDEQKSLYQINKIKSISDEEYKLFLNYMKTHLNMYNEKVNILNESIMLHTHTDKEYHVKVLNAGLNDYKKMVEENIQIIDNVYNKVNANIAFDVREKHFNIFSKMFSNYNAGIVSIDKDMEKQITKYFTANHKENRESGIDKKLEEITSNIQKEVDSFVFKRENLVVKKNKM